MYLGRRFAVDVAARMSAAGQTMNQGNSKAPSAPIMRTTNPRVSQDRHSAPSYEGAQPRPSQEAIARQTLSSQQGDQRRVSGTQQRQDPPPPASRTAAAAVAAAAAAAQPARLSSISVSSAMKAGTAEQAAVDAAPAAGASAPGDASQSGAPVASRARMREAVHSAEQDAAEGCASSILQS